MEMMILFVLAAMVAALGTWMAVAVADNWIHPVLNRDSVAMVVGLDLMEQDYPEHHAYVAHRKIDDENTITLLFQLIRAAETLAAIVLWIGALMLAGAALGWVAPLAALAIGIAGAALFVLVWAGFIIGGNYFAYWYCHQWAQQNHFSLLYWGLLVLIVLFAGGGPLV